MKIGLIIASLGGGGAERIVLSLCRGLQALENETDVICLDASRTMAVDNDTKVHSLSSVESTSSLVKTLSFPVQVWKFRQYARQEGYSHYISHMERSNIILMICSILFPAVFPRKKCVLTVHNHLASSLKGKSLYKRLAARLLYIISARLGFIMAFVSECGRIDASELFNFDNGKTAVLPNFVPVDEIKTDAQQPIPPKWEKVFNNPVILGVGRLTLQKGFKHLIKAFSRISEKHPEAQLVILGDGPLKEELVTLATQLNIEDKLHFPGFIPNPFSWIQRARVFAMSSIYEGMPMVLLEALACSAAIVSTDCFSGPREVLAPGTDVKKVAQGIEEHTYGVLTPPIESRNTVDDSELTRSEKLLADAITPFIADEKYGLLFRSAAVERSAHYDILTGARRWKRLLEDKESMTRTR